jgi:hypothetical protein
MLTHLAPHQLVEGEGALRLHLSFKLISIINVFGIQKPKGRTRRSGAGGMGPEGTGGPFCLVSSLHLESSRVVLCLGGRPVTPCSPAQQFLHRLNSIYLSDFMKPQ